MEEPDQPDLAHDNRLDEKLSQSSGSLKPKSSNDGVSNDVHKDVTHDPVNPDTEAAMVPQTESTAPEIDVEKAPPKPPVNPMMDPSSFPDGGLEAWLVVLGAFCSLFVSFGWINCIGVFQDYYETHQLKQYSPSDIAWVPSLETFMMFIGGPIFGKMFDNYGPRWLLLFGTFFHVFGLMMTSISKTYYQFILSQGICSPLGASMIFYPSMSSVSTWFFKRRGFAFGVTASGSSLGGVIFPILVQRLIPQVGFGWSMRIAAFLILALLVVSNLTIRSRIGPQPRPFVLKHFVSPLAEAPFFLTAAANFLFFWGMFLPFNYIILQAVSHGMSENLAQYLVPILNAASVFGRTLPGFIADKVGRFNTITVMSYFSSILVLALWLPSKGNAAIIVFAVFYGFGSGAFVGMGPALVAQISDVRQIGVRTGTLFAVVSFAALTGTPIGGALVTDDHGKFTKMQIFSGVVMMGGSTFFVAARTRLVGLRLNAKV